VSESDGVYVAPDLKTGVYDIEVEKSGFKLLKTVGIVLHVNENLRRDIQMEVGSVTSSVEVTGRSTMVDSYTSALSQTVSGRQVVDLPLSNRDVTALAYLVAGATDPVSTTFYATSAGFQGGSSPSINGGRVQDNSYFLDGMSNTYVERFSANIYPNPDAMEEVSMNTGQYTAEFGGRAGGYLSGRSKSGTNNLHGTLFEFVRNDYFNARNFFDTTGQNDGVKRNQFGWAIGGPVYIPHVFDGRNKLFWFNSFQRVPFSQRGAPGSHLAFTAAEKQGDFSDRFTRQTRQLPSPLCNGTVLTVDTGAIFDPASANPACGSLGAPYPNNQIPRSSLDPVAVNWLKQTPNAATPSSPIYYTVPQKTAQWEISQKVDLNLGDKHAIMGRWMKAVNPGSGFNDANDLMYTSSTNAYGAHAETNVYSFTETWTPTPTVVVTGGVQRANWPWWQVPMPHLYTMTDFGSDPKALPTSDTCKQWQFNISGLVNVGSRQDKCGVRFDWMWQYTASLKWQKGRHDIGIGFDYERWGRPDIAGFPNQQWPGIFNFTGGFTGLGAADFLIGHANNWSPQNPVPYNTEGNRFLYSLYFQDNFRVRKNLTLNLGVRWEPANSARLFNDAPGDKIPAQSWYQPGRQSTVFPLAPVGVLYTGDAGMPGINETFERWDQVSPRFGFAWDPTGAGRWSLRGGAGFYAGMIEGGADVQGSGIRTPPLGATTLSIPNVTNLVNPWIGITPYNGTNPFPLPLPTSASRPVTPFGIGSDQWNPFVKAPMTYQWSFTVERSFGTDFLIRTTYIGTRGVHQAFAPTYNLPVYIPGASSIANVQSRRPDQNFTTIQQTEGSADSYYNAFQLTVQKRYQHGFALLGSYTLSKSTDSVSTNVAICCAASPNDPRGPGFNRGLSDYDRTHVFTLSPILDLPKFAGQNRFVRAVLGNWTTSGILSLRTGYPLTISEGNSSFGSLSGTFAGRADLTSIPVTTTSNHDAIWHVGYFNQSAFTHPALGTFGTEGRNSGALRSPGFANYDAMLSKQFPLREKMQLQFRFETYNSLNRVNFCAAPDLNVSSATFGRTTSTGSGLDNCTPRMLQFGMKFMF